MTLAHGENNPHLSIILLIYYSVIAHKPSDINPTKYFIRKGVFAITAGVQSIKDDLCADRLAAAQREVEAERRENVNLRAQLTTATTADAIYARLRDCPIGTTPVYGSQPIFTCPVNVANGAGCGCNGFN